MATASTFIDFHYHCPSPRAVKKFHYLSFRQDVTTVRRLVTNLGDFHQFEEQWNRVLRKGCEPSPETGVVLYEFVSGAKLYRNFGGYWAVRGTDADGADVRRAMDELISSASKVL